MPTIAFFFHNFAADKVYVAGFKAFCKERAGSKGFNRILKDVLSVLQHGDNSSLGSLQAFSCAFVKGLVEQADAYKLDDQSRKQD